MRLKLLKLKINSSQNNFKKISSNFYFQKKKIDCINPHKLYKYHEMKPKYTILIKHLECIIHTVHKICIAVKEI